MNELCELKCIFFYGLYRTQSFGRLRKQNVCDVGKTKTGGNMISQTGERICHIILVNVFMTKFILHIFS